MSCSAMCLIFLTGQLSMPKRDNPLRARFPQLQRPDIAKQICDRRNAAQSPHIGREEGLASRGEHER